VAILPADKSRVKQSLFCRRVERSRYLRFAWSGTNRSGKASKREYLKAPFSRRQLLNIFNVKLVPGIAGVIHYDLRCHS
jgi:hypothetical protein